MPNTLHNIYLFCAGVCRYRKPVLPPNCAPCDELNLSQVAIKHSEALTKDVLFVALVRPQRFLIVVSGTEVVYNWHASNRGSACAARYRAEGVGVRGPGPVA